MKNNYETMRNQMRPYFLTFDQQEMIRKFDLQQDESYLYIRFCSRPYRIDRASGIVEWSEDGFVTCFEGDYSESMTIYDILCYSRPDCHLSGEFSPTSSLEGTGYTGMKAGSGTASCRIENFFNENIQQLAAACVALGGVPEGKGDIAYRIPLFDFLPVRFAFWQADEDFPPQITMLFDSNILQFMHYETIWFAAGHLLARIEEQMQK